MGAKAKEIIVAMSSMIWFLSNTKRHSVEVIAKDQTTLAHFNSHLSTSKSKDPLLYSILSSLNPITLKFSPTIHHDHMVCAVQHPHTSSCFQGAYDTTRDVANGLWKTYAIINSISFLIGFAKSLHSKNKNPDQHKVSLKSRLFKLTTTTIRNTAMVSCYVGVFSYFLCLLRTKTRERPLNYGIAGFLACPTIFIDKPGRLTELNAYVVTKILESFIIALQSWKKITYNR